MTGFHTPGIVILTLVTTLAISLAGQNLSLLVTAFLTLVGILLALERNINELSFSTLVALAGSLSGIVSGLLLKGHKSALASLAGEWVLMSLLIIVAIACLIKARTQSPKIAIRIIGSWITAASLLMMGFLLKHPQ